MSGKHGTFDIGQNRVIETDDTFKHFFPLLQDIDQIAAKFLFDGTWLIPRGFQFAEGGYGRRHKENFMVCGGVFIRESANKNARNTVT